MRYINWMLKNQMRKLSCIGLGTARFGTLLPEKESFLLLDYFFEHGGNLIDTARNYYEWVDGGRGISEQTIGKWMEKNRLRDRMILSTKCGVCNMGKKWIINLSYENIYEELMESEEALKTSYIDLYLLHRDEPERDVGEIAETMNKIYCENNIGAIGLCNWRYDRIVAINDYVRKRGLVPFNIIQNWWSVAEYTNHMWDDPTTTHMDEDTYKYMKKNNCLGMAYTSQSKGYFQKSIKNGIEHVDKFLRYRIETPRNLKKIEYIRSYCVSKKIEPTAFVLGYITSNELPGIALVSCNRLEQLVDILANVDYKLPKNEIYNIDHV